MLAEQVQVVVTSTGQLQHQLIDLGIQDGREQEVVMPLPGRPGGPVAGADVERPLRPAAPLADARKDRVTAVELGDVVDELLNKNRFTNASTTN